MLIIIYNGRRLLTKFPFLLGFASTVFNKTIGLNKIRVRGENNVISGLNQSFLRRSRVRIIGSGNTVSIQRMSYLQNCSFYIHGNNNKIVIGEKTYARAGDFHMEDDHNVITLGNSTAIYGFTHIAATEGSKVLVGERCMFSSDVVIRTGDSHSIVDMDGVRINHADDVVIGDHVWFGNKSTILKGSVIKSNSIIGTGAIVTRHFERENVILAGNPAKVIKENVNWIRERI